ncbi:unnamed protein product [Phaeothamnion confervicola]
MLPLVSTLVVRSTALRPSPSQIPSVTVMKLRGATKTPPAILVEVERLNPIEAEAWKLQPVIDILRDGGVGIIPTDTSFAFVCDVHSRQGVEKIFQLKNVQRQRKPLSLLCKDISTIAKYTAGINKNIFRILKATLPGPYTFILPATHEVPKVFLEHKHHSRTWKRREVGVRMPDDPICLEILRSLESPLLCGSVPKGPAGAPDAAAEAIAAAARGEDEAAEAEADLLWASPSRLANEPAVIYERWKRNVDFIVDAGPIASDRLSTVVDIMGAAPVVLREGAGDVGVVLAGV